MMRKYIFVLLLFIPVVSYSDNGFLDQLRNNKFGLIDNLIKEYESNSYIDAESEEELSIIYNQISRSISERDLIYLDDWIRQDRNNHIPYIIKGMYLYDLAWRHRGGRYIKYTPEENLRKMSEVFFLAEKDLLKAININPGAITAYNDLIGIYFATGHGETKAFDIHEKGIRKNPDSVTIRSRYLRYLLPRWGISYEQRQKYVDKVEKLSKTNNKLKIVLSYNYAQLAEEANDYKVSAQLYNKALSYGYQCSIHKNKSKMLFRYKHYKHALDELNIIVEKCPKYASGFLIRGRTLQKLGDDNAALLDLDVALALSPGDPQILGTRGFFHLRKKRYRQAITDLSEALTKEQISAWMWDNRGHAYYKLKMYDEAISDFTSTLIVDPYYLRAYRRRGNSYKKIQQYDLALQDYTAGLKIDPDNVRLLIQRARLNNHVFYDTASALKDLNHALTIEPKNKRAMKLHYKIKSL